MQPETLEPYDNVDFDISQATFDSVFQKLTELGAISLHQYLQGSDSIGISSTNNSSSYPSTSFSPPPASPTRSSHCARHDAVSRLNDTCQRVFGNTDPLRYEFLEENGPKSKQCILTIARHDGTQRSYTTQPMFSKKAEAKAEVSRIAIEMGALEFLLSGLSAVASSSIQVQPAVESFVDIIEGFCIQWRAGRVAPRWITLTEPKLGLKYGCALQVKLSPHVDHVYMTEPTFDTYDEAKDACAKAAISEGALHFIKHGDGQVRPHSPRQSPNLPSDEGIKHLEHRKPPLTLQNFFDSLPRPLPETFDTSDAYRINASAWLSSLIQNSKGGKFAATFYYISGATPGLHGCLLRVDRPGTYKAYLVDAEFVKRSDAKSAVCLQAMSRGVGEYIRSIVSSVETKLTSQMRSFSNNYIYPALQSELNKIDSSLYPHCEFEKERNAFGATLFIKLSTSSTPEQSRKYVVPCEYRNKADAKAAVIALAAEQGVVEYVRFRGRPPPPGYCSPYKLQDYDGDTQRKRPQPDSPDDGQARPSKKQKRNAPRGSGNDSSFPGGPCGHEGRRSQERHDGGVGHNQRYGVPGPDRAGGAQELRTDWHIVAGSGDIYEQGIDYPRSSGLPPHGLASSCHYGQLSFNGPFPLSLPLDPCPYVSSGTNGLLGTGTFNTVQSPATHSLSPLFPIIAQHSIPPGRSSAPTPLFIDTAAVPLTPACSTNSALEPGEVRSPISPRCGQDPRSCIQSRVYVREPGIASTKTVDPRRKNKPRPRSDT
ncbi:hypothetical protein EDC04DRAFT_741974 [Pisolithus marmoratus]|nr:hypothetical protein EDC04DRAFT_741974 [Pisolithus marmoratus]